MSNATIDVRGYGVGDFTDLTLPWLVAFGRHFGLQLDGYSRTTLGTARTLTPRALSAFASSTKRFAMFEVTDSRHDDCRIVLQRKHSLGLREPVEGCGVVVRLPDRGLPDRELPEGSLRSAVDDLIGQFADVYRASISRDDDALRTLVRDRDKAETPLETGTGAEWYALLAERLWSRYYDRETLAAAPCSPTFRADGAVEWFAYPQLREFDAGRVEALRDYLATHARTGGKPASRAFDVLEMSAADARVTFGPQQLSDLARALKVDFDWHVLERPGRSEGMQGGAPPEFFEHFGPRRRKPANYLATDGNHYLVIARTPAGGTVVRFAVPAGEAAPPVVVTGLLEEWFAAEVARRHWRTAPLKNPLGELRAGLT